jgi:hypothetical protein
MRTIVSAVFILALTAGSMLAQQSSKPWTEWSKKEVDKTLNDSAWGQTQSEGGQSSQPSSTSAISTTTTGRREDSNLTAAGRTESGDVKASPLVKYHMRFLSAKPVRAAFARMVLMSQAQPNPDLAGQLQEFVNRDFADYIVVTVSMEVSDQKRATPLLNAFTSATTEVLQKNVYLERKDGKRLFLMEYRAPSADGMGAKFVFPRTVDGQPFLTQSDNVRFVAQLNEKTKLNARYKLAEMMYEGKLEY